MSTLEQIRSNLAHAGETLAQGWRHLWDRAGDALTRFTPVPRRDSEQKPDEPVQQQGARWALLAAEVVEDPDHVEVRVEVPGLDAADLDISVQEQMLLVRGEKHVQRDRQQGRYYLLERAYGAFERAIPLPVPVDDGKADARYRDGVLTVRLPKASTARQRRITVEERP